MVKREDIKIIKERTKFYKYRYSLRRKHLDKDNFNWMNEICIFVF